MATGEAPEESLWYGDIGVLLREKLLEEKLVVVEVLMKMSTDVTVEDAAEWHDLYPNNLDDAYVVADVDNIFYNATMQSILGGGFCYPTIFIVDENYYWLMHDIDMDPTDGTNHYRVRDYLEAL